MKAATAAMTRPGIWLLLAFLAACASPPEPLTITGATMGTTYTVKIRAVDGGRVPNPRDLRRAISAELHRLSALMSTYDTNSEVSRFNRFPQTSWFSVSADTMKVLRAAQRISRQTDGAFDITVAPLVNLWGFGPGGGKNHEPRASIIEQTKRHTGYTRLVLDPDGLRIRKTIPRLAIDLSAIAKGYAVDALAAMLEQRGCESFLVEIGGEVKTRGTREDGAPWRVALEKPETGSRSIAFVLPLTDRAVATSGTYRNFFEENGKRYSHTIDPRTGRPVTHRLVAVSVTHDSCMVADGWATALMVLGPREGVQRANAAGVAALFTIANNTGFRRETSLSWNFSSH